MKLAKWFAPLAILWAALLSACDMPKRQIDVTAYGAKWCHACKEDSGTLQLVERLATVRRIDVDSPEGKRAGLSSVPYYVIRVDGQRVFDSADADRVLRECRRLQGP